MSKGHRHVPCGPGMLHKFVSALIYFLFCSLAVRLVPCLQLSAYGPCTIQRKLWIKRKASRSVNLMQIEYILQLFLATDLPLGQMLCSLTPPRKTFYEIFISYVLKCTSLLKQPKATEATGYLMSSVMFIPPKQCFRHLRIFLPCMRHKSFLPPRIDWENYFMYMLTYMPLFVHLSSPKSAYLQ